MSDPLPAKNSRVTHLPNNTFIVTTKAGAILVNCPPETLKYVLAYGYQTPQIILLPPDVPPGRQLGSSGFLRQGINYASVEFMLYANYFVQGRETRLITPTADQAGRLHLILEETFEGPRDDAVYGDLLWLKWECQAVSHIPDLGRSPRYSDLCTIEHFTAERLFDLGEGVVIRFNPNEQQYLFFEDGAQIAAISTQIEKIARPLTLAPARPLLRRQLTLQFIGGSDGFDPTGITTCFLAYLSHDVLTQATLFDTAAYLRQRLGNLGLSTGQISEVVISHLHEDHVAGLPELLLMGEHRVRIITSDFIYRGLLRLLSAVLALPQKEIATLFDFLPLNPGRPLVLGDRTFEAIYAIHSVPTLAVRVNGLYYSGDMRYDERLFAELVDKGILSDERRQQLISFAEGAEILVQDAGGGPIHTTVTPELLETLTAKGQRIVLAHTSEKNLPPGLEPYRSHIEIAGSGTITSLGEVNIRTPDVEILETIEACPLFVRLPFEERLRLSQKAQIQFWQNGEVVVENGIPVSDSVYLVHSGLLEVHSATRGQITQVAGRGSTIGEQALLLRGRPGLRPYTALAREDLQLLKIDAAEFHRVADILELETAFIRAEWLGRQPLFEDLLWITLLDLALDFTPRRLAAGETLFNYGEPGFESYLLVSGKIDILSAGGELVDTIEQPNDFFGGQAALYHQLRNAAAVAAAPSEIWALPAAALQRLQMVYPHLLLHLRAVEYGRTGEPSS